MAVRFVVSKSRMVRIPCDGPIDAEIASRKREEEMEAAGLQPDVEIEYVKKPVPRARPEPGLSGARNCATNRKVGSFPSLILSYIHAQPSLAANGPYLCSKSTGAVTSCTRKYFASARYFRAPAPYIP